MLKKIFLPLIAIFAFIPGSSWSSQSANYQINEYAVLLTGGESAAGSLSLNSSMGESFIGASVSSEHVLISGFFEALALPSGGAVPYMVDLPQYKTIMALKNKFDPAKGEHMLVKFKVTDPSSRVSIKLYTPAGELVKILVDETLSFGEYARTWFGKNQADATVASGIYLIHAKIGSHTEILKAAVLKK